MTKSQLRISCFVLGAALLLTACQAPRVESPLTPQLGSAEPAVQLEFWHQLTEQRLASNDEAFHAILLFMNVQDLPELYGQRVTRLLELGLLDASFDRPGDEAITRGTFAVVLARALEIRGGVTMRLLGATPRYAMRELVYLNIYPPSSPQQLFSGNDIVSIIGRAEDYQRAQQARLTRK